ncbi:MAG: Mur ligase family protein [Candidatus Omnitrophota bacterium]|nr:UDP-N-acetylmuramoylalanine--D-glutamate ligase [Candidatus Omnitrophota bacterium]MBU1929527.1 UDP-N-acetylmuramoylalanine--D-glutamate ligase [Candidatus Omnitrophota bacterium]MBU2035814.1 UDP-N-acetylmuramoylalanine--D-glutamate ligase [Candidatus Omnitrophota bacterium]MBU2258639.1 UDP-N-acetylmuramoylalanine--D-glutamate ligase [Candidatus Omnitrophota bacterium]
MINKDYFKGKSVAIIGLARSGLSCANLLHSLGARVWVTDCLDNKSTRLNSRKLRSADIKSELGKHSPGFIKGRDIIVASPGVSDESKPLIWAKGEGIPVISEVEVAGILCPGQIIAVTGSNGKTTVTTLISKILKTAGKNVFTCGNIGNPFCGEVKRIKESDFVCLEVSSFQLQKIKKFKPKVSVVLNFCRNHLDRHKDMREYLEAKKRIFKNQGPDDFTVLNSDDKTVKGLGERTRSRVVYFKGTSKLNSNQAAAVKVAGIFGISREFCERIFKDFKGIEHRMEFVGELNRVKFINDSKATTAESTAWALRNISSPIILIAGGRHKGVDYSLALPEALEKVKLVILIGEARDKIKKAFKNALPVDEALSLEDAVKKAYSKTVAGDCVLLSPMCSSFDMFSSYEERGRIFKKIVAQLVKIKCAG